MKRDTQQWGIPPSTPQFISRLDVAEFQKIVFGYESKDPTNVLIYCDDPPVPEQ